VQPPEVELDCLLLEHDEVLGQVETLDAQHDKAGLVAAGEPDVVQVIEAHAELGATQGVFRRLQLSSHTLGLETLDAGSSEVHIGSPSSHGRLLVDRLDWDARTLHGLGEVGPGLRLGLVEILGAGLHVSNACALVNKGVLPDAVGVSADRHSLLFLRA